MNEETKQTPDGRTSPEVLENVFALIAQKHLGIETLEVRNSDRLDFHDVSVWGVRRAFEEVLKVGIEIGASMRKPTEREIAKP